MKIIELVSQHNHYDIESDHTTIYNECGLINPDC